MALNPTRELTNRKILLEELEQSKKLLKQGVVPPVNSTTTFASGAITTIKPNMPHYCNLKPSKLERILQQMASFEHPKVNLEQYSTSAHLASIVLTEIQKNYGDIENCLVADLGCGGGMLTAGAALLGAAHCIGFEIDGDALDVYLDNMDLLKLDNCEALRCNVLEGTCWDRWKNSFNTVITNPPFGTRNQQGADLEFVNIGLQLGEVVYSFHKSSTRRHVLKKAKDNGYNSTVLAQLKFDLPNTYRFHKKNSVDIYVDLVRSCI